CFICYSRNQLVIHVFNKCLLNNNRYEQTRNPGKRYPSQPAFPFCNQHYRNGYCHNRNGDKKESRCCGRLGNDSIIVVAYVQCRRIIGKPEEMKRPKQAEVNRCTEKYIGVVDIY